MTIKRYCFHCKKVEIFWYCDGCNKYFCASHSEWEFEFGMGYHVIAYYPVHNACRIDD